MSLRNITILSAMLLAYSCSFAAEVYKVRIDAPSEIQDILNKYLDLANQREAKDLDEEQIESMVAAAPEQSRKLLKTEGYFQAKVAVSHEKDTWVVSVEPGEPINVGQVLIAIDGAIQKSADYQQRLSLAKAAWSLPVGARFRQEDWESSKKSVLRTLSTKSYPLAKLTASRALIDPDTHSATLIVHFDSGDNIRFGATEILGNQRYPLSVAQGMADFSLGSDYDQQKIIDYQSRLEQDAHYSSAIVSADFARVNNGRVPIVVELNEEPRQKIELGVSYDTIDSFGTRINYEHYNIFNRGYTGSIFANLKTNDKKISLGLGLPRNAKNYSHSANVSYETSDIQNLLTKTKSAAIWRIREHGNIRSRVGIQFLSETSSIDSSTQDQQRGHALLGTFGWKQLAVDKTTHPRQGYLFDASFSVTPGKIASSAALVSLKAKTIGYLTPWPSKYGTFIGRFEAAQVWTKNANLVPQSLLFRTGGSNSVRGYEYQSLGIKYGDAVIGGRVLAVASAEYQLPIVDEWAAAAFYDTGNAADSWSAFSRTSSYGVGARWFSPLAPLSIDIARAIDDKRWRLNFTVGLSF